MQHKVGMKSEWDERYQQSFILKCDQTYLATMRTLAHFHLQGMTRG